MNKKEIKQWIVDKIEHYTPYRPITDSLEMKEVRMVLAKLLELMDADRIMNAEVKTK